MIAKEDPLVRLLRSCHLLSTLTREVLEKGYLRSAGIAGVSFAQVNLLKFLDSPVPRSIGDVMRFSGASFPAASKMVARLKKKGLIRTGKNPADIRAQIVAITSSGRALIRRYEAEKFRRVRKLLRGLSAPDLVLLTHPLEELIGRLLSEKRLLSDVCMQCGAYYSDTCLVPDRRCRVKAHHVEAK